MTGVQSKNNIINPKNINIMNIKSNLILILSILYVLLFAHSTIKIHKAEKQRNQLSDIVRNLYDINPTNAAIVEEYCKEFEITIEELNNWSYCY